MKNTPGGYEAALFYSSKNCRGSGNLEIAKIGNLAIEKLRRQAPFNYPITNFGNYQISFSVLLSVPLCGISGEGFAVTIDIDTRRPEVSPLEFIDSQHRHH